MNLGKFNHTPNIELSMKSFKANRPNKISNKAPRLNNNYFQYEKRVRFILKI